MVDRRRYVVRVFVVAAIFLVASCSSVKTPEIPPAWTPADLKGPLTHDDAIGLALRSAPTSAAWRARYAKAHAALKQAKKLPNPAFQASWEDFGLYSGATAEALQQTFSLAYALSEVFSRPYRERAARYDLSAEAATIRADAAALAADVTVAYDEVLFARRKAALADETVRSITAFRDDLRRLAAGGVESSFAVEKAAADLMDAERERFAANGEAEAAESALVFALGFERPIRGIVLADAPTAPAEPAALDLERALAAAAANRPELAAADLRYRATLERARLEARRLKFLPTLGFGGRTVSDEARGVASLDVEVPIFDAGDAAVAAADADLLAALAEARKAAAKVAEETADAVDRERRAAAALDGFVRPAVRARAALLERAERLYAAGEMTIDDRSQIRRDALTARIAEAEAERELALAASAVRFATGACAGSFDLSAAGLLPTSSPSAP